MQFRTLKTEKSTHNSMSYPHLTKLNDKNFNIFETKIANER